MEKTQRETSLPASSSQKKLSSTRATIALVLFLYFALYAFMQWRSINSRSATYDEPMHLTAGYLALACHDYSLDSSHPPFLREWAALPLLFRSDVHADVETIRSWSYDNYLPNSYRYATEFVHSPAGNEGKLHSARMMIAFWGGVLGLLIFLWTFEWLGLWPAVFALLFFLLEPNLSAHASLITTDIGAACFYFASVYFFWRTCRRYTVFNVAGTAVFVGLAMVSKFSAVLLAPTFVLLTALAVGWKKTMTPRHACLLGIAVIGMSYLAIWAAYGFRYQPTTDSSFTWAIGSYFKTPHPGDWLGNLCTWLDKHQLLPNAFIQGLAIGIRHAQYVPSFLNGAINTEGWWYYFPMAFVIKTPLPLILLLLAAAIIAIVRSRDYEHTALWFLCTCVCIYMVAAINSRINIGLRHILPIYPFILVFSGLVIREIQVSSTARTVKQIVLAGVLIWWGARFVSTFPHTLTYFNQLAGGPRGGRAYLTDSNIDWGQHLKSLKRWMKKNSVETINLAYFGTADPTFYGIKRVTLPGNMSITARSESKPVLPGYVAISETLFSGVYWSNETKILYLGFRRLEPVAIVGHTIRIYKIDSWPVQEILDGSVFKQSSTKDVISLADHLVRIGWPELATLYFKALLTVEPKNSVVYAKLGTLYWRNNKLSAAIAAYKNAAEYRPDKIKYKAMLCSLLIENDQPHEAKIYAMDWIRLVPNSPEAHYCLASIYAATNDNVQAYRELKLAAKLDPTNAELQKELQQFEAGARR